MLENALVQVVAARQIENLYFGAPPRDGLHVLVAEVPKSEQWYELSVIKRESSWEHLDITLNFLTYRHESSLILTRDRKEEVTIS
jgi:hypothetical protein